MEEKVKDQVTLSPAIMVRKESFTWCTGIPMPEEQWIWSDDYEMNGFATDDTLSFGIRSHLVDDITHLEIVLKKTYTVSVRAKVNVCIVEYGIQRIETVHSWSDSFYLKRFSLASLCDYERIIDIFIEINWLPAGNSLREPEPTNLYNKIGKFLTDSTFSDATIVIGNREIKVHKIILCSYSSVFHDMFTIPMREERENRVEIIDFTIDTVKMVLKFLYTGVYEDFDDLDPALEVLTFAQKYNMIELKDICEYILSNYISLDNVLYILNEADDHRALSLEEKCLEVMNANRTALRLLKQDEMQKLCQAKPLLMFKFLMTIL